MNDFTSTQIMQMQIAQAELWRNLGGERYFNDGIHYSHSGLDRAFFNVVNLFQNSDMQKVYEIIECFRKKNRSWSWWLEDTSPLSAKILAEKFALKEKFYSSAFALDILTYKQETKYISDFKVTNNMSLFCNDWTKVFADGFATTNENADAWAKCYIQANDSFEHIIACRSHQPIAILTLFHYEDITVFLGLTVISEMRRQGLACEILHYALNYIKNKGIRFATLGSTDMSTNLYSKLGFKKIYGYHVFVEEM